jgi:ATP-dependent helicase/nuclease subunit A
VEAKASGGRLWRNVDKLLNDARKSGQVSVRSFLETLETMNDAGAREGEAPADADGNVVLMTIHKSKGLEYPVVVLADAGRTRRGSRENVYLFKEFGVTFKLSQPPMLYKMAKELDSDQDSCEDLRVLYVALTRAKSKLLISAHCKINKKGEIMLDQWARNLFEISGAQPAELIKNAGKPFTIQMTSEHQLKVWCAFSGSQIPKIKNPVAETKSAPLSDKIPLYHLTEGFLAQTVEDTEHEVWQVTRESEEVSGRVLGKMVHQAIQRWLFPGDPGLDSLLEMEAFNFGLAHEGQRKNAIDRASMLLTRLRQHPIWDEINSAKERFSELPYTFLVEDNPEMRIVDLLYHTSNGWQLIDFKTDKISNQSYKDELVKKYSSQVKRYKGVLVSALGQPVRSRICFLDDQGSIQFIEI